VRRTALRRALLRLTVRRYGSAEPATEATLAGAAPVGGA
jgi:hypothetical protein